MYDEHKVVEWLDNCRHRWYGPVVYVPVVCIAVIILLALLAWYGCLYGLEKVGIAKVDNG